MIVRQSGHRDKPMPRIASRIDPRSQEFRDNEAAMRELAAQLKAEVARAARGRLGPGG